MIALTSYGSRIGIDGRVYIRAGIQADTAPDPMPRTGAGIDGIADDAALDIGSRINILDASEEYVLGEDWVWHLWQTNTGGGGGTTVVIPSLDMDASLVSDGGAAAADIEKSGTDKAVRWHLYLRNITGKDGKPAEVTAERTPEGVRIVAVSGDGTETEAVLNDGRDGDPGTPGRDGTSLQVDTKPVEGGTEVTIYDADGSKTFTIHDGTDGHDGETPTVGLQRIEGGTRVTVYVAGQAEQSFDVMDGTDGEDGEDGHTPVIGVSKQPISGGTRVTFSVDGQEAESVDIMDGTPGTDGETPTLEIGTVTTGEPGTAAKASIDNVSGNRYALSMRIPQGQPGEAAGGPRLYGVSGAAWPDGDNMLYRIYSQAAVNTLPFNVLRKGDIIITQIAPFYWDYTSKTARGGVELLPGDKQLKALSTVLYGSMFTQGSVQDSANATPVPTLYALEVVDDIIYLDDYAWRMRNMIKAGQLGRGKVYDNTNNMPIFILKHSANEIIPVVHDYTFEPATPTTATVGEMLGTTPKFNGLDRGVVIDTNLEPEWYGWFVAPDKSSAFLTTAQVDDPDEVGRKTTFKTNGTFYAVGDMFMYGQHWDVAFPVTVTGGTGGAGDIEFEW